MNVYKKYFVKYAKYWTFFLLSIISSLLGMLISLLSISRIFNEFGVNPRFNMIVSSLVAAIIGGLPIYFVNNKIYVKNKYDNKKGLLIIQLMTAATFFILIYFCLYFLIIDFRMN